MASNNPQFNGTFDRDGDSRLKIEGFFGLQKKYAYITGTTKIEYIGFAAAGTLSSEPYWYIRKYIYEGDNVVDEIIANNNPQFTYVWDNKESYFS